MKQIIDVNEASILDKYLGKIITVFCCRYIYAGKLIKIDSKDIVLADPKIVYETGAFSSNDWKDAQSLDTNEWAISLQSIESYGVLNKS
jgi:hypothetical protein